MGAGPSSIWKLGGPMGAGPSSLPGVRRMSHDGWPIFQDPPTPEYPSRVLRSRAWPDPANYLDAYNRPFSPSCNNHLASDGNNLPENVSTPRVLLGSTKSPMNINAAAERQFKDCSATTTLSSFSPNTSEDSDGLRLREIASLSRINETSPILGGAGFLSFLSIGVGSCTAPAGFLSATEPTRSAIDLVPTRPAIDLVPTRPAIDLVPARHHAPPLTMERLPYRLKSLDVLYLNPIQLRALKIANSLENSLENYPFDKLIWCNFGDPQKVGQRPVTYIREVMSLMLDSRLIDMVEKKDPSLERLYDSFSIRRAKRYLKGFVSAGCYTEPRGNIEIREDVRQFLGNRDKVIPNVDSIYITNGAVEGIEAILQCLIDAPNDAIMIPVPQFPIYQAMITKFGGQACYYYLHEAGGWSLQQRDLEEAYSEATSRGSNVKGLVVISPGNPAPTLLNYDEICAILRFASDKRLCVIADEVYQELVYEPTRPFCSFRSVLLRERLNAQLVSLHSASKGTTGECGLRGGFFQLENVEPESADVIQTLISCRNSSNNMGQVAIGLVVNPPGPDEKNYELAKAERSQIFDELKKKAEKLTDFFDSLTGVTCQPIVAAMYAFPKIKFSQKAIEAADSQKLSIESFYGISLVEATGIVVSGGDAFGQLAGTHHMRITILPSLSDLQECLPRYRDFHESFMQTY